jgi:hypothetical protein
MKTSALVLSVVLCSPAAGVLHPYLEGPVITSCTTNPDGGPDCGYGVMYSSAGLSLADIVPLTTPHPNRGLTLKAVGVHCAFGDSNTGVPFTRCSWIPYQDHAPTLSNTCKLADRTSWVLASDSSCSLKYNTWGPHSGAGPGGECIMFVQSPVDTPVDGVLRTIYGDLSAEQVANAGSTFCQKPLPPSLPCEIDLPAIIDHGTIGTTEHNVVSVVGSVDCGVKPVISVLGGNTLTLGPGVTSDLTLQLDGATHVRVTSAVNSSNATPGDYNGTRVVIASPY